MLHQKTDWEFPQAKDGLSEEVGNDLVIGKPNVREALRKARTTANLRHIADSVRMSAVGAV